VTADKQQLAEAAGDVMYSNDIACQNLGIELRSISPGRAEMTMTVREHMLNGHDVCHGGFIFTLADSCFSYACNSHNNSTLAAGARIDFLAPAASGDVLLAKAEERALAGRTGIYDVVVNNQEGKQIALFRGNSHRIRGELVPQGEEN